MVPDTDDEKKRIFLVIKDKFEQAGVSISDFEKEHGFARDYLARVIAQRRNSPRLIAAMVKRLELQSTEFPYGITNKDFEPIQRRLQAKQLSVVGKPYRGDVERKSLNWKTMTADHMQQLVWEHPSSVIGVMCGVSDVAIGKFCRKNNITKPPRGYWAKQGRYTPLPSRQGSGI